MNFFKFYPLFLLFLFVNQVFAQTSKSNNHAVSIRTNSIQTNDTIFPASNYRDAMEERFNQKIIALPGEKKNQSMIPVNMNAFVCAVHLAYAKHYPLILSPDAIWLLICQGISTHINLNTKSLQKKIVYHKEKKSIRIIIKDENRNYEKINWNLVIDSMTYLCNNNLKKSIRDDFIANFSTTGQIERTVYAITFLESMKSYFNFELGFACGIPEITLLGTSDDWKEIRRKAMVVEKFGLKTWGKSLYPVLDQFVKASQGNVDTLFWSTIYRLDNNCGNHVNGWILNFFPYSDMGETLFNSSGNLTEVSTAAFPSGLSKVPFKVLNLGDSDTLALEMVAGFVGVNQNPETRAVCPEIAWAITPSKITPDTLPNAIEFYDSLFINKVELPNSFTMLYWIGPLEHTIFLSPLDTSQILIANQIANAPILNYNGEKNFQIIIDNLQKSFQSIISKAKYFKPLSISFTITMGGKLEFLYISGLKVPHRINREINKTLEPLKILKPAMLGVTYQDVRFKFVFNQEKIESSWE